MGSKKNHFGFSLIEITIAVTVLVLGITAAQQVRSYTSRQTKAATINSEALSEHKTLNSLVQGIQINNAYSVFQRGNPINFRFNCLPHPWGVFTSDPNGSDRCDPNPAVAVPFVESTWTALSQNYYQFSLGNQTGAGFNPVLNQTTFVNIQNNMQALGCMNCHDGSAVNIAPNLSDFDQLTNPNAAFVTLFGLGSGLGRRLLDNNMNFPSLRANPALADLNHNLQFFPSRRVINSNIPNNFEWNCAVGQIVGGERVVNGCTMNPPCPPGALSQGTPECNCERIHRSEKKTNVSGCNWKTRYGCYEPPERVPSPIDFCTRGVVRPGSQVFPAPEDSLQLQRCQIRFPPATWTFTSTDGSRTYPTPYRYWECWNPEETNAFDQQRRWEVSYQLTTTWTNVGDTLPRTLVTTGALK